MPKILGNPVTKFRTVENLAEVLEENDVFEEHETEDAEEVVQEGDCCGDEITSSQDTETTVSESWQSLPS